MGELFAKMTVSQVQDWANAGLILSLAVGVVSTFIVVWTGNIKESNLKREVSTANAVAANASEKAANANERAQVIERDNINLKADLERTIIEADLEKQKLSQMKIEVANARKQQAEAEQSLEQLRERMRPRSLTIEQKDLLIKLLRIPMGTPQRFYVDLVYNIGDQEAFTYAAQIKAVLDAAGWQTHEPEQVAFVGAPVVGVLLQISDPKHPPRHAAILQQSFSKIGVSVEGQVSPQISKDDIKLIIGSKH